MKPTPLTLTPLSTKPVICVGARVRSHDFGPPSERPGREPCYCEGVVEAIGPFAGCAGTCPHYHIRVEKRVWAGEEVPVPEHEKYVYPALNWCFIEVVP